MKLKKINEEHYVVVDETIQPVNGYYYDFLINKIKSTNGAEYAEASHCWQITHSTQPIDKNGYLGKVMPLTLTIFEIKELIGEVDVLQESKNYVLSKFKSDTDLEQLNCYKHIETYIQGYNQAIEDNKERKYTEAQLIWAIQEAYGHGQNDEFDGVNKAEKSIIVITNYLQPKTEWEVDIINGKLTLI